MCVLIWIFSWECIFRQFLVLRRHKRIGPQLYLQLNEASTKCTLTTVFQSITHGLLTLYMSEATGSLSVADGLVSWPVCGRSRGLSVQCWATSLVCHGPHLQPPQTSCIFVTVPHFLRLLSGPSRSPLATLKLECPSFLAWEISPFTHLAKKLCSLWRKGCFYFLPCSFCSKE